MQNNFSKAIDTLNDCLDLFDQRKKILHQLTDSEISELMALGCKLQRLKIVKPIGDEFKNKIYFDRKVI